MLNALTIFAGTAAVARNLTQGTLLRVTVTDEDNLPTVTFKAEWIRHTSTRTGRKDCLARESLLPVWTISSLNNNTRIIQN